MRTFWKLLREMFSFERIHERPWVYASTFFVPIFIVAIGFSIHGHGPIAGIGMIFLFGDAVWRHRMQEIDRDFRALREASDRKFDRRNRVIAQAAIDPAYYRQLFVAIAERGDEVMDNFPLPEGKN